MRSVAAVLVAVLVTASCSSRNDSDLAGGAEEPQALAIELAQAGPGGGRGLPPGAIHVDRAVVLDATGFEAPVAAATLFLPRGWQAQGGVLWAYEFMCTNGYNVSWSATSPDGLLSVNLLPQERWETNNYSGQASTPGCQPAPYTNVRQYLESVIQRWRPGARPLDYRPREDLQREYARLNNVTPTPIGEMRTWVEGGEILFAFNDRAGEMRGSVAAVAIFSLTRTNAGAGLPVMDALTGYAMPAFGATAPNGRLNLAFFEAIRRSIKPNPQWEARIANHNAAIGRVALEESRKRSQMIAQSNAEISRIREEAWNAYQESSDRRAREFSEVIRGVETYDDANAPGGQVQLSGHYDHAWRLNDGSYVLTNDSNFEPWRDLGLEGNRLEATR
jgi:hypothetical protein